MSESGDLQQQVQELKTRLEDFERLYKIFRSVSSSLQTENVLKMIISEALDLCHADQGSIILFDPDQEQLTKTLIRSADKTTSRIDSHLNNLLAGWVHEHKQSFMTNDITKLFGAKSIKQKYRPISSVLSVPLIKKQKILGVINLISLDNKFRFVEREMQLMDILATQCVHLIVNAHLHESLFQETNRLRKELDKRYTFKEVIGNSPKLMEVFSLLERIIPTDARVMIEGESGTGKELIARILHYNGPNKEGPFVAVDCGAFPENLLESELFGYVKGAFTGAFQDKPGLFEEADNGTLFLDEITNMPTSIQSKLLRVLQENEIRPVGSTKSKKVKVRVLSAASESLKERLKEGKFREDLYYRLSVVIVHLPPLRERVADMPQLANYFLNKYSGKYHKRIIGLKKETLQVLESYVWPGNIRELENVIERCIILAESGIKYIPLELLPDDIIYYAAESPSKRKQKFQSNKVSIKEKKVDFEKEMIIKALVRNNWNQSQAADVLGLHESTLRYKMRKYGIKKSK
jgi:transcriptional regulator with GAF, ATPase, and Fis domain